MPLSNQGWNPYYSESGVVSSLPEKSERYIQVFLDGGLINQRMGIFDAVAAAKILNTSLVIPYLERTLSSTLSLRSLSLNIH
nr:O-fucosyltransferase 39-like isoform X1 [Ipomoea batatas]